MYGLIGKQVSRRSWAVPIHSAFGREDYQLIDLKPDGLTDFFKRADLQGINVSDYRHGAFLFCDELDNTARRAGSVNAIVRQPNGKLSGHNTALFGLLYAAGRAKIDFSGRKALILGSGVMSLAAQAAARLKGAREVAVASRGDYETLAARHADAEVLINATPVGMYPDNGQLLADPGDFPRLRGVIDMVYNPCRTALLMRAEDLGIPHAGGLPLLVAQAAAAEELFGNAGARDAIEAVLSHMRRRTLNIVLIGMPGSGKSTVGDELADLTGRPLVDIDREIVRAAGRSIEDIFSRSGEGEFRRIETEQTWIAGKECECIIVTGGGAVKDPRNYPPLRQNSRIYHIQRDVSLLAREGRPLSIGADLNEMYRQRLPMYARFRDAEAPNAGTPRETAEAIWRDFCENAGRE